MPILPTNLSIQIVLFLLVIYMLFFYANNVNSTFELYMFIFGSSSILLLKDPCFKCCFFLDCYYSSKRTATQRKKLLPN